MTINISKPSSFISMNELNQIFREFASFDKTDQERSIIIHFNGKIERFDIVFIAGLFLHHKIYGTSFEVHFGQIDNERIFEVRQYLMQITQLYEIHWKNIFTYFQYITELKEDLDYIASESFAPILLINRDTVDNTFTNPKSGAYDDLKNKYIKNLLGGHYNNSEELAYMNDPEDSVIKKLMTKAPIYSFVFSILYRKILPFKDYKTRKIADPVERTIELWYFTEEFVAGLLELAKNIVEHSQHAEGIITIRAYDAPYTDSNEKVLETYVFDFGTVGIIPQLIQDTRTKDNPVFQADLEILKKGFYLKNFIEPTVRNKLNQQLYREIAHYGLIKFFNLIKRNEGIIISASKAYDGKRDIYSSGIDDLKKTLSLGTSFYFQLPFLPQLFQPDNTEKYTGKEMHASNQMITALSELLVIKITNDPNDRSPEKKLLDMKLPSMQIRNREDENKLCSLFSETIKNQTIQYLAVDMECIDLSSSSLLRFFAYLSTKLPQSIIIYNVKCDQYQTLLEDNTLYFEKILQKNEIPYWYADKGILIFSHLADCRFYFADILYGSNERNFYSINNIISHTFPNTLTICRKNIIPESDPDIPECIRPFFYQSSLLPFDLILHTGKEKNLFQNNLENILNQKLYK